MDYPADYHAYMAQPKVRDSILAVLLILAEHGPARDSTGRTVEVGGICNHLALAVAARIEDDDIRTSIYEFVSAHSQSYAEFCPYSSQGRWGIEGSASDQFRREWCRRTRYALIENSELWHKGP